ncbi:MAG: tRNA (N6-isopentenyl adenosine(37)-C2)-methylthiotransferase MiaB [Deltaproteobacteria bacterium]|nr:tRNA (N6-isopentenyl adenosine(37)-C2)-methylthiotransferase MiaB [Deltaproteobacteria bacterium]MDL1960878.1 tRNA (N6-isopentenyl adenosine(37)-C2)-methylthiotransferase MiaB [Deltaproteobacteria bacterium]
MKLLNFNNVSAASPRNRGRKRLYLATFGCQMNEYDSQRIAQILHEKYALTSKPDNADLILVNTCSIREKAENKVYSLVGRLKKFKKQKPDLIIGIAGCVAQQEGDRLLKRLPFIDLVFGPQCIYGLPDMLKDVEKGMGAVLHTELKHDFLIPLITAPLSEPNPVQAFVTIMQGCDNFCTFCVVPYVRGREVSRPPEDILAEISQILDKGVKEVTLLGQNVNSYGKKVDTCPDFPGLLHMVAEIPGLERLRFTTSHPKDISLDLIKCFRDLDTLCEHLHLPVQSGSTTVLKRMNRHYTRDQYLATVENLKSLCPNITLTTDLIVGFPGETDRDFEDTISLLKTVKFDQIFAFKYSPRPLTRAAGFDNHVPEEIKAERLEAVLELQKEIGFMRYKSLEGREEEILVEGLSKKNQEELRGRTRGNHVVNFSGPQELIGKFVTVKIIKACYHSLRGKILIP